MNIVSKQFVKEQLLWRRGLCNELQELKFIVFGIELLQVRHADGLLLIA